MENSFVCEHCGQQYGAEDHILISGRHICRQCADEITVVCDCCGAAVFTEDSVTDGHRTLCNYCYENYFYRCTRCDRIIREGDAFFDDEDNPYCESCYGRVESSSAIRDYYYRPDPVFHGAGIRYFGVELEIDGNGENRKHARQLLDIANADAENLYIKHDGSLDEGMELVTHPMTLDYHLNVMPWVEVLAKAVSLGYNSHRTTTCGLHVHISREAFGDTLLKQELAIARLLYFVEKFWPELLRFSRRTERQINRWAARYGMKLSPQEVMDSAKDSRMGRYTAVNLTNDETIEIRIFRGTLKLNTLLATLQMVNAICDVALSLSDEDLQALSWHDFLNRIHEPELIQYLKERNLYKNDPVTYEEDE